ncbi:hypothetical protein NPIL_586591 [Nephila pilipes]|uniref:Uncharacterized protein n=1 Tax=Nephila pilipes TaxID=299642 RepID=A0A8X6JGX1_NEPPI|nr:hypothetical protein NPIL_586591 [Nephila pilipes]
MLRNASTSNTSRLVFGVGRIPWEISIRGVEGTRAQDFSRKRDESCSGEEEKTQERIRKNINTATWNICALDVIQRDHLTTYNRESTRVN